MISGDNPKFAEHAQKTGHDTLGQSLDAIGLDYEPTRGKYGGVPERSYIVHNPTLEQMLSLGKQYGQESVIYSKGGRPQLHFTNGPNEGLSTPPPDPVQHFTMHTQGEPADDYSVIPGPNGEPYGYFTYNLDFENPLVPSRPQQVAPGAAPVMAKHTVDAPTAARRILKAAVDAYHETLVELRLRELAKAQRNEMKNNVTSLLKSQVDVAKNKANGGLVKTIGGEQVAQAHGARFPIKGKAPQAPAPQPTPPPAKKAEVPAAKRNPANGGMKKEEVAANDANGGLEKAQCSCGKCKWCAGSKQVKKGEFVTKNKANGGLLKALNWGAKPKQVGPKSGSGSDPKGAKGLVSKAETKMSTPGAPKPPQAAGAAPTMHKAFSFGAAGVENAKRNGPPAPGPAAPAPKATPRPPSDYDAAAFQPPAKVGMPAPAGVAAPKPKLPIAGMSRIVGAPQRTLKGELPMKPRNKANGSPVRQG